MADQKRPHTTQRLPTNKPVEDFSEAELTQPGSPFRHPLPPRIAAPLGGEPPRSGMLKPPPKGLPLPGQRPLTATAATAVPSPAPGGAPAPGPVPAPEAPSAIGTTTTDSELIRVHQVPRPDALDDRLFMARAPDSEVAASFRVLRHRLTERAGLRVIAVTSPGRGEGKTTVALNLALALGESNRAKVLLLETNLRQPALAKTLGFRPPVCFGEQLELHRTHPLQPWIVAENISPSLHVAAVSPDAQPRALIDGPAIGILIEQLRNSDYHHIVLDCPPVLGSADVNLLAEHVDGVLFAMWMRRSRLRSLRRAVDQIGKAKVIGSVLVGG